MAYLMQKEYVTQEINRLDALDKQAALRAEATAVVTAKFENNVYRDGHQFDSNVINGVPLANIRLEYEVKNERISEKLFLQPETATS